MDGLVCRGAISDANIWVQPDAFGIGERVVDVDEAAFGGFDVVFCEGIGNTAEVDPVNTVKGFGIECNWLLTIGVRLVFLLDERSRKNGKCL